MDQKIEAALAAAAEYVRLRAAAAGLEDDLQAARLEADLALVAADEAAWAVTGPHHHVRYAGQLYHRHRATPDRARHLLVAVSPPDLGGGP